MFKSLFKHFHPAFAVDAKRCNGPGFQALDGYGFTTFIADAVCAVIKSFKRLSDFIDQSAFAVT